MAKQNITLKVAGKSYPMEIDSAEEEIYRLAEKAVGTCFSRCEMNARDGYAAQDNLAIAAIMIARANIKLQSGRSMDEDEVDRLSALVAKVDRYLNK